MIPEKGRKAAPPAKTEVRKDLSQTTIREADGLIKPEPLRVDDERRPPKGGPPSAARAGVKMDYCETIPPVCRVFSISISSSQDQLKIRSVSFIDR